MKVGKSLYSQKHYKDLGSQVVMAKLCYGFCSEANLYKLPWDAKSADSSGRRTQKGFSPTKSLIKNFFFGKLCEYISSKRDKNHFWDPYENFHLILINKRVKYKTFQET